MGTASTNAQHHQDGAGDDGDPEGRVDLEPRHVTLRWISASPRPWSTNSWANCDEHGGQRDQAEVDVGQDVGQDREDDQLDQLAAPRVDERPRQAAGDSLLERALLVPWSGGTH